ncbi:nucleoside hydrolase [Agrobacterium larrymoorei]|uniref:Nucleoside hydrolase n=1 Tax=Agrobacterium larrymoorei TaxID=160699 RepID=A0A4D7DU81_9HYPH|nr:nucleoside hydrolase [Agrobacterium larrymoorei]QCJ01086.1 nucleoside hydrolase [Agrobacterium larrymoorei]QYA10103.1 nucleoside hydrolase [Agrobacterium larrymoorei]
MARKLIILTDPGQDQAAPILMFLGQPQSFDVLGLVATAGNINLANTINNCLKLLELAGRPDIPVFAGCVHPLVRPLVMAEHVHGPTGLDGPDLPSPSILAQDQHGVDFIIDTVRAHPGEITICSLSPTTNLAMALREEPDIADKIQEIVAMLGAYFEVGNITPTAEFNCYVDPEAADIVLKSGVKTTLLPLDVTHRMLSNRERLDAMRAVGSRCGVALAEMLEFSAASDLKKYGWEGAPLHGLCVSAFMAAPQLFSGRDVIVSVELAGTLTTGMTVVDWWQITNRPKNAFYVRDCVASDSYRLLNQSLANLP